MNGVVGLEAFDLTNFDPGQPACWEALGNAWAVTHASMPTQEQLMQFVFSNVPLAQSQLPPQSGAPITPAVTQQPSHPSPQYSTPPEYPPHPQERCEDQGHWQKQNGPERQWDGPPQGPRAGWRGRAGSLSGGDHYSGPGKGRGRGRGDFDRGRGRVDSGWRGFGRGRGDHGHGNDRGQYNAGGRGGWQDQESDAVVLSGDNHHSWQEQPEMRQPAYPVQPVAEQSFQPQSSYSPPSQFQTQQEYGAPSQSAQETAGGEGGEVGVGRMQKVGDKWVFVRGAA
ncbi:hypothetical protein BN946_scf184987.g4 [Trametes cinnabarina]|uniref:Uncharacterized protein n=1 Tax=Pycnoporus cinnabarinus TaxID=5643 RepID=A0A060SUM7_PYCCI|nr:hypothetical protein BN946_scf184987.g4 [Trametes cinnabarina]